MQYTRTWRRENVDREPTQVDRTTLILRTVKEAMASGWIVDHVVSYDEWAGPNTAAAKITLAVTWPDEGQW